MHNLGNTAFNTSFAVNCQWSSYGERSECTKTCGGGEMISNRTILQQALDGGQECEGNELKIEKCNETPCPGTSINVHYTQLNIETILEKRV